MNSKLESLFGWLMVLGFPILALALFLAFWIPGRLAGFKQVTFDRARASLSAALSDITGATMIEPKRYGYFEVWACTNNVTVRGTNYPLAFWTSEEFQFDGEGRLAVTSNRQFFWLDNHRGAKLIPDDYKVSKWHPGY